jgi:anti-sigma-K factor RskA
MTPQEILIAEAGEYVAGLMSPMEAENFERMIATDADTRAAVAMWREKLMPLDETAPQVAPTPALWDRIERAIGAEPMVKPTGQGFFTRLAGLWADVGALRLGSMAGALAALVLAVVLVVRPDAPPLKPTVVAVLNNPTTQEPMAIVEAFADGRVRVVHLRDVAVPEGRTMQVWTLWDRQVGPRSVGLLERPVERQFQTSGFPQPTGNQLFEITLEPAGGSPTGRPTGPILCVGRATTPL